METKYLRINPADNVAVAIVNLPAGEHLSVDGIEITLNEDIPAGHKFALKDFVVICYGNSLLSLQSTSQLAYS